MEATNTQYSKKLATEGSETQLTPEVYTLSTVNSLCISILLRIRFAEQVGFAFATFGSEQIGFALQRRLDLHSLPSVANKLD